jgi:hypothetical protein
LLQAGIAARDDHRQKKQLLHFKIDMISFHGAGYGHSLIYQAENLIPALKYEFISIFKNDFNSDLFRRVIFEEDL